MSSAENVTQLVSTRSPARLLVVSNRLPVVFKKKKNTDSWSSAIGSGGLVSALMPVLRDRGGNWIGWPGFAGEDPSLDPYLDVLADDVGYGLGSVYLSEEEVDGFYQGFSNEVLWPLFHDLSFDGRFDPDHWRIYREVNRKFVAKIVSVYKPNDLIWVHDYHLIGVGAGLRRHGLTNRIGFFLHIPFPPPDTFLKLPWRAGILSAMLDYDLVGFQTMRDCRNFLACLRALYKVRVRGKGQVQSLTSSPLSPEVGSPHTEHLRIGCFPISIDFDHYAGLAGSERVSVEVDELERSFGPCRIILSVDRLDYTKGLLAKLRAFRLALERYPELHGNTVLSLHVVPSREQIPDYYRLRIDLEQFVSEINGAWSRPGWIPIHYFYHSLTPEELTAYYRRADIMFVSPLKDGMNLVAKEYCASHIDDDGVLVLSEFAGAAAELQTGALLINPYDTERTAERILEASRLDRNERRRRMRKLRRQIRHHDIYHWVNSYLQAIAGRDLDDFPKVEDYVPGPPPKARVVHE